jgi:putative membrane protein
LATVQSPRVPLALLALFAVVWSVLAIDASPRFGWFVEQLLVAVALPVLILSYRRFRFSNLSYALITVFLIVHEIGAHWSYWVPLPWEEWGFARNHYDRVVHFAFGLLLALPVWEFLGRVVGLQGRWRAVFTVDVIVVASVAYEVIEWLAALVLAPDAGDRFVGLQGDLFDPVKDIALGGLGAILAMLSTMRLRSRRAAEPVAS